MLKNNLYYSLGFHLPDWDKDGVKNWLHKEGYNTDTFLGFDD